MDAEKLPCGWRTSWPTAEEIAGHDGLSSPGWWLARCSLGGLKGFLFLGFFDEERTFTITTPPLDDDDPPDTWSTTVAPGWSFCPIDEGGGCTLGAREQAGAAADLPARERGQELIERAAADAVLIWSNKLEAWWKPRGCGYTKLRAEAGIYARSNALERTRRDYDGRIVGLLDAFDERSARAAIRRRRSHVE